MKMIRLRFISLAVALLMLVPVFASCGGKDPTPSNDGTPAVTDGVTTDAPSDTAPADTADHTTEVPSTNSPVTTVPVVTDAPITEPPATEPPATEPPETEPVVVDPFNAPVPEGTKKDISWFDDAVFIGDSRIGGFQLVAGVWNAEYITFPGMTVKYFFDYDFYPLNGENVTAKEALQSLGTNYKKVYINLGLNELGWAFFSVYYNKLGEIVDTIRAFNPNADIYLITVMPVSEQRSKQVYYESLENVAAINELIAQVAREKKVYYVDVDSIFRDAKGYLPEGYASDGVHLNRDPIMTWRDYLLTHTMEKN